MPWSTRPTLTETDDGSLLIRRVGPLRSEFINETGWFAYVGGIALVIAESSVVAKWGWPTRWADISAQPTPILLGLIALVFAAIASILRRRQRRPRTDRIDAQGVEHQAAFGAARRLAWSDIPCVFWIADRMSLNAAPGKESIDFYQADFSPGDWSIVRGRVEAALRPRFDLPSDPKVSPPFRWVRITLTSLFPAVLLGGATVLMPGFGPRPLALVIFLSLGGTFQYLMILGLWGRLLSQPNLGNPYLPVRLAPADLAAPPVALEPRPRSATSSIRADADGVLVMSKDGTSNDDKVRIFNALAIALVMTLCAAVWVFEPRIDRRVAEPSTKAVVVFGTLALWAIVWAAGECRRAYWEFDRGTWRIETDRVEFASSDGTIQALRADEVERVLWESWSIRLRGRESEIRLVPHGIGSVAWQPVRDRVGAMLAPRFDLGPLPTPPDAGRRFLWAVAPILLVPLVAAPIALAVPTDQFDLALLGWWGSTVLANAYLIRFVRRERDDWLWRRPRGGAGQEGIVASAR